MVTDADLIPLMIKSAGAALRSGLYDVAADMCRALGALTNHQAVQDGAAVVRVPLLGQTRDEQPSLPSQYECTYCGTPAQEFLRLGAAEGESWRHDMHVTSEGYPYNPIVPHTPVRPVRP